MPTHISLSDIARSSRSVSVFGSRLEPVSCVLDWVVRVVGFDPRSGPAQPNPARPGPPRPGAARPWRPHPPMRPFSSPSLIWISRATTSLSLFHLSPRGALGIGDDDHWNLDPEVSSPPLPFSSLSLSLPFSSLRAPLSLSPARSGARPRPGPRARRRSPAPTPAPRGGACPRFGLPRGGARPPRLGPVAAPAPAPAPSPRRRPPAPAWPARPLLAPRRGGSAPRRGPAPARGVPALGVARVTSARPRAPPFTPDAFPRAQS
jgi:hypothetical protein